MLKPASVLENETHKLLWDFDMQTDHLILAWWPGLIIISNKKENLKNCAVPADHRVKLKENVKKNKYLDLASELKKKKNCVIYKWQLYLLWLVLLVQSPKDY